MSKRLVESMRGVGAVHAGDLLLRRTTYDLSLWAEDQMAVGGSSTPPKIEGHIDITGIQEAVVLSGPGTLTLTVEDGRRMSFELTSSTGAIAGRGWLP
jgi:hypothetical protein